MGSDQPNVRTVAYKNMLERLPAEIQALAQCAFKLFEVNPSHPSLRVHELGDNRRGNHQSGSVSVSITRIYRAIYVKDGSTNVWYWIGTHSDYNRFTGSC